MSDQRPQAWGCHEQFACESDASAAVVWRALTDPARTARYLMGLAARSSWGTDDVIELRHPGMHPEMPLVGRVIRADPPRQLTYWVAAKEGDPATYLTWDVTDRPEGGTHVRLRIDEMEGCAVTTATELRRIWTPILQAFELLLAEEAGT